jgi:hypothetical protein
VEELDKRRTVEGDHNYIMNMKKNKTTGFDGIPAQMWQQLSKTNDLLEY